MTMSPARLKDRRPSPLKIPTDPKEVLREMGRIPHIHEKIFKMFTSMRKSEDWESPTSPDRSPSKIEKKR